MHLILIFDMDLIVIIQLLSNCRCIPFVILDPNVDRSFQMTKILP